MIMKRTILLILAFAVSILCFTSCEKEPPSVGSTQDIYGSWECTEVPKRNTLFFIKGDIIRFGGDNYVLSHPDNREEGGHYSISGNTLILKPTGDGEYEFKLYYGGNSFKLSKNGQGGDFVFNRK